MNIGPERNQPYGTRSHGSRHASPGRALPHPAARLCWVFCLVGLVVAGCEPRSEVSAQENRAGGARPPSFLVVILDDLGFSDYGFLGSEVATPNIDRLAASGLVLSRFYVGPTCSPTRSMLLTGIDHHRVGLGTMAGDAHGEQIGHPGYVGYLTRRARTVASRLAEAGYRTLFSGKWHLGGGAYGPDLRGFDRSFALLQGGASHFADGIGLTRDNPAAYVENGTAVTRLPVDFWASRFYGEWLGEHLEEAIRDDVPFFAIFAPTAPHWPLHAPDEWIERYRGVYDDGWDALRERRAQAIGQSGVLDAAPTVPERLDFVTPWDQLDDSQRRIEARKMEVYAAMVSATDEALGRLLERLRAGGRLENTLVVVFSDNGPEGNPIEQLADNASWIPRAFDNREANIGRPGSYTWLGPGWAQATNGGLRLFKTFPSEGGVRVPAVIRLPGPIEEPAAGDRRPVRRVREAITVRDLAPTLLELANIAPRDDGRAPTLEMSGRSVGTLLRAAQRAAYGGNADAEVEPPPHQAEALGWELFGRRALIMDDQKILWVPPPYGPGRWQLFDLSTDPAEQIDLAREEPDRLREMSDAWQIWARENEVILPPYDTSYARLPEPE